MVYKIVTKIPEGRVTTYKAIANSIGKENVRIIGMILKNNANPIIVPCHRVVNSDGRIGGYVYGKRMKQILLECEGITIKNERIIGFERILFNSF